MQDRPTYEELLDAVREFLERDVVPALEGTRKFHARVAANVLAIVRRELAAESAQLAAEWLRLDALLASESMPADLVVMGTHGRSGFERLMLGSITEKVLRRAACPVLTVPPAVASAFLWVYRWDE